MCPGPGVWSAFSGYCDRKECSHLPAACLRNESPLIRGMPSFPVPWPSHSWWCHSLHLQGDDLGGQVFTKICVLICEQMWRYYENQSRIVISKAMHHHLTMPVISLVLMKGKPARCWWITSVPCHTFQWIKIMLLFIVWESMICVSLLYLWKKLSCPWAASAPVSSQNSVQSHL